MTNPLRMLLQLARMGLAGFTLAGLALLTACGASGQGEVVKWMEEQRANMKPTVRPIPEPKRFVPYAYTQATAVEPFNQQKLAVALKQEVARSNTLVTPELNRRKEPLEAYPLDAIAVVGSLTRGGKPSALVSADKLLYEVRVGNYLGQNFGRIVKITETELTLREIVQDASGEWIERNATLQLQERK